MVIDIYFISTLRFYLELIMSENCRITLRAMEQFIAVAEELHFHRAAKRLNMSQPPLTMAIRKLEEDINVTLINRENRVLGLTDAGKKFLLEARQTLKQAALTVSSTQGIASGQIGKLRLGYVGSALYGRLPDVIHQFRLEHPNIQLELREATTAAQVNDLRNDILDIGVIIPPLTNVNDIQLSEFDRDSLCIAVAKSHRLSQQMEVLLAQLEDEPFILWPMTEGRGFHLRVFKLCAQAGFIPQVAQEAHGMHAVLSLVAVGAGVSIVPKSMQDFCHDRIRYYSIEGQDTEFELMLGTLAMSPLAQKFISLAKIADSKE